jgi:membrane protease YdiL (CAAX protease family)
MVKNAEVDRRARVDTLAISVFLILAIVLGSLWSEHARAAGMLHRPDTAGQAAWIAQLTVLISALVTMTLFARAAFKQMGWHLGPLRIYGFVACVTVAVTGLVTAVGVFLHALVFSPHIPTRQAVFIIGFLFVGSTFFAFAEEFGWRGFLLPKLLPLGIVPALLISGVCWFAWELPLVLFGLLDTTLLPINAPVTLICHLLQDVSVGVLFGFLRLRYNSLPLSTFAHGFLNTMGAFAFLFFGERNPMLGDFAGPIGTLILLLLAAFILKKSSKIRLAGGISAPE